MNILDTVVFAEGEQAAQNTQQQAATTQQDANAQQQQQQGGNSIMGMVMTFFPFILIIALLYFMMIRPQRKREKEAREMINALKLGDKVVTIGGICGKVCKIKDQFIWIESGNVGTPDEKSVIKFERDAVKTVESAKN